MNNQMLRILVLCIGISTTLAACGGANAPRTPSPSQMTPTNAASVANPAETLPTIAPSDTVAPTGGEQPTTTTSDNSNDTPTATDEAAQPEPTETDQTVIANTDCDIITQADATQLLGSDASQDLNDAATTDQVEFSVTETSAIQSDCSYTAGTSGVHYVIDKPDKASPADWAKLWQEHIDTPSADQTDVPGVGDGAYYSNGQLVVKKGNDYVTIEVTLPDVESGTTDGDKKLIDIEKSFAFKALSQLKA